MLCVRYAPHVPVVDQTPQHGASIYADEWDDTGVLHYRGTGLHGDQRLDYEGNRWLCGFIPCSRLFSEAEMVRRCGDRLKSGFLNGIAEHAPDLDEGYRSA
jgi:hypothetical protein